jgi:hypothetical protein
MVVGVSDVGGDGRGDLLVGAPGENGGTDEAGRAYLFDGGYPLGLSLLPDMPPVVVPPGGGTFAYTGAITNTSSGLLSLDAWVTVTLPNGNPYGPVAGPTVLALPPGATRSRGLTAAVPSGAPPGTYTLTLNVGTHP